MNGLSHSFVRKNHSRKTSFPSHPIIHLKKRAIIENGSFFCSNPFLAFSECDMTKSRVNVMAMEKYRKPLV
ncbi:hypothetical protein [Laceyella putida]|uniref:Uncharacterized protein n=1 Tax=Laceyella putida TaxID=110101 RepID=A0ABW2RKZ3_9BACL